MADDPNAPPIADLTSQAAPAPGSPQGQADGSPPAEADPTSGGNETDREKDLRRKITAQAEENAELKKAAQILDRVMNEPEFAAIEARLTGKAPPDGGVDLDEQVFTAEGKEVGKKWKEALLAEAERRVMQKMGGVVREVGNTVAEKTIVKALAAEGLAPSAAFETFAEDFEAENPSYKQVRKADPAAAARWLASSFSIHVKREGRTPMGNRAEASLERGGGSPARVGSAASQVKINQRDPNKILRLHEAITKGETPVDENGVPYKIVRH